MMHEIFLEAMRAKESNDYSVIARMIAEVDITAASIELVAALRGTCSIKSQIPEWDSLFLKVEAEIERRGFNSRKMLRGLHHLVGTHASIQEHDGSAKLDVGSGAQGQAEGSQAAQRDLRPND